MRGSKAKKIRRSMHLNYTPNEYRRKKKKYKKGIKL